MVLIRHALIVLIAVVVLILMFPIIAIVGSLFVALAQAIL